MYALQAQLYQPAPDRKPFDQYLGDIVGDRSVGMFVARTEQIVGQLLCRVVTEPGRRYGLIGGVVVDASARGQGVARQLLASAYGYAKDVGCATVELTTRKPEAQVLYLSEQFEPVPTTVLRRNVQPSDY